MINMTTEQCAPRAVLAQRSQHAMLALLVIGLCLALTACGSTPIDKTKYSNVESSIADAKEIKADEYAGGELYDAQEKLKDAHAAEEAGDNDKALRLIKEAGLQAKLAETRTRSAQAQKSLDRINAGLSTLQDEISR